MLEWIWNMQSIVLLLSHNVCLPLKTKLGSFKKKISGCIGLGSNPYWDVVQIIQVKCTPLQSKYLQTRHYGFQVAKCVQKVSFKLQSWYKKKPKITSQIKTQVAKQTFIYLFIIIIIIIMKGDDFITFFLLFLSQLSLAYKSFLTYKTKINYNNHKIT